MSEARRRLSSAAPYCPSRAVAHCLSPLHAGRHVQARLCCVASPPARLAALLICDGAPAGMFSGICEAS